METRTAKLFMNGGSQAVRLPAEFRFPSVDEVHIRRDPATGDVILSVRPPNRSWKQFLAVRDAGPAPDDFLADRPLNEPLPTSRIDDD